MSLYTTKKMVNYRSWIVALVNAGVTWIILIIAPLGLFAVIICTLGVFLSSLAVGWVCDRTLLSILAANQREMMMGMGESEHLEDGGGEVRNERSFSTQEFKNLPDRF
ncbi:MAG: CRISPR-associated protein Csx18 [Crinalium sp.]